MEITDVRVSLTPKPIQEKSNELIHFYGSARCNVGGITLRGMRIKYHTAKKRFWVQMPDQRGSDGTYRPLFFPNTKEARAELEAAVLAAAKAADEARKQAASEAPPPIG